MPLKIFELSEKLNDFFKDKFVSYAIEWYVRHTTNTSPFPSFSSWKTKIQKWNRQIVLICQFLNVSKIKKKVAEKFFTKSGISTWDFGKIKKRHDALRNERIIEMYSKNENRLDKFTYHAEVIQPVYDLKPEL